MCCGVARVYGGVYVALATPTSTRLLDNFLLSLCEQCSEYQIMHLLNFAPFSHTNIRGLPQAEYRLAKCMSLP